MSNPTVSFRISNFHLARGLRAIRALEPNWRLTTPSDLIRTIFNDYIAKSEFHSNTPLDIDPALLKEITLARAGRSKQQNNNLAPLPQLVEPSPRELKEQRIFDEVKREHQEKLVRQANQSVSTDKQIDEQIAQTFKSEQKPLPKPSEFDDPNITESKISSVTDFSPPKEWSDKQ